MPVEPVDSPSDSGFALVRRGYDPGQVDTHLRRIDAEISILAADRNAAVDQAAQLARELDDSRARAERLRAQVRTLAGPPQSVQGMSERMRSMLRLAEDEVADMLARAETTATARMQEAEQEATRIVTAAKEEAAAKLGPAQLEATELAERVVRERAQIASDRITMEREITSRRAAVEEELTERRAALEQELTERQAELEARVAAERTEVLAELTERRTTVEREIAEARSRAETEHAQAFGEAQRRHALEEEDFAIAMEQRRTEALAVLATQQAEAQRDIQESRAGNAVRVREELARAQAEARRIVDDAQRRVVELTSLRERVARQLDGARATLGGVANALAPLPGESAEPTNGTAHDAPTLPATEPATNGTLTDVAVPRENGSREHAVTTGRRRPRPTPAHAGD